jgi:iron complex transport system ATP-binding protein
MNDIIEIKDLSFSYQPEVAMLSNISLNVPRGGFLAIAGPNGAGKTTLFNLINGLLKPVSGTIVVDSRNIHDYSTNQKARKIAVVRQEYIPVFDFNVTEVVMMARSPYVGAFGFENSEDIEIVKQALEMTDTARFAQRSLAHLSGGERQRVFIARAFAQNTDILLLDEPTTYLDLKHQLEIFDLLKRMQLDKGKTIVVITHDVNLASQYCDQMMLLASDSSYIIAQPNDFLDPAQIKRTFNVDGYTGRVSNQRFFLPLGKYSRDNPKNNRNTQSSLQ